MTKSGPTQALSDSAGQCRVALLGPMLVNGREGLQLRDRTVIGVLLVRNGVRVTTDEIAFALWGDAVPPSYRKVIQGSIMRLRRQLGGEAIRTVDDGYRLSQDPDGTDVHRFEQLIERARGQLAARHAERAARSAARGARPVAWSSARRARRVGAGGGRVASSPGRARQCGRPSARGDARRGPSRRGCRRGRAIDRGLTVPGAPLGVVGEGALRCGPPGRGAVQAPWPAGCSARRARCGSDPGDRCAGVGRSSPGPRAGDRAGCGCGCSMPVAGIARLRTR